MQQTQKQNKQWICEECPLNEGDTCGPFPENHESFPQMKNFHYGHDGWKEYTETNVESLATSDTNNDKTESRKNLSEIFKITDDKKELEEKYGIGVEQIESCCNKLVKDDAKLVKKLLRVCFSAYTNNPLNLAIMAPTSEGKTYTTVQVTNLFPKKDVIFVGKMSPTALIHQNGIRVDSDGDSIEETLNDLNKELSVKENRKEAEQRIAQLLKGAKNLVDLSNKILVFSEPPNPELWEILKPILSHDRFEIEYKTTRGDGSLTVKETIIRGFPAVIVCTAKNEKSNPVWDEIETRFDMTSPNTSVQKYRQANQFTALKRGMPSIASEAIVHNDEIKCAKHNIHRIKEAILNYHEEMKEPILNPFHEIIGNSFPSNEGISMRNCDRFCTYSNVETMINADKNCKIQFKDTNDVMKKVVITSLKDVDTAIDMMGDMTVIPPEKSKFLTDVFDPCVGGSLDATVTTDTLVTKYTQVYSGKTITGKKMLDNYLTPLSKDYGILDSNKSEHDGRMNLWKYSSKPNTNSLDFIREKIIEQSKNDPSFIKSRIDELIEYSKNNVELDCVLDPQGRPVNVDKIQNLIVPPQPNISGENQAQPQEQNQSFESSKIASDPN